MAVNGQVLIERQAGNGTNFQKETPSNQAEISGTRRVIEQAEANAYEKSDQVAPVDSIISLLDIQHLTVDMLGSLVFNNRKAASITLLTIMDKALEASQSGQKNASVISKHARFAVKMYRTWEIE